MEHTAPGSPVPRARPPGPPPAGGSPSWSAWAPTPRRCPTPGRPRLATRPRRSNWPSPPDRQPPWTSQPGWSRCRRVALAETAIPTLGPRNGACLRDQAGARCDQRRPGPLDSPVAGPSPAVRGYSSVGRALPWHGRGQGFNSP